MNIRNRPRWCAILLAVVLSACATTSPEDQADPPNTFEELVAFFEEWQDYRVPELVDGVPDYSASNMAAQFAEFPKWQARLNAFDTTGWSVPEQVDWYLVWAQLNGFDFAHRVKKPWARDPAFYVWFFSYLTDVPEREGPNANGVIELTSEYGWPLTQAEAADVAVRLRNAPKLFVQAKTNLTGNARDLWVTGIRSIMAQSNDLAGFAGRVQQDYPDLADAAMEAKAASDDLAAWLQERAEGKTGPSGVGKENYTWNLKNVHLLPYSWEDEVLLMERELARSHSALRLTEHKNKNLPKLEKIENAEEYRERFEQAVADYYRFLDEREIMTLKPYVEPALKARINEFQESEGIRGFFAEVHYRDPIIMRTHDYHWIELARIREEPHERLFRRIAQPYNLFDGRAEGMATAMEELMLNAGFLEDRPRSKELIYILLAQRAARALGGLYQHGLEMTHQESTVFASKWTPWGLLPADGETIQWEEQFYLRQPAYGTSYLIGKLEIDKLIAEYARQREGQFVMKEFMDEFNSKGVIPVSLIYWEMTGDKSMLERALNR